MKRTCDNCSMDFCLRDRLKLSDGEEWVLEKQQECMTNKRNRWSPDMDTLLVMFEKLKNCANCADYKLRSCRTSPKRMNKCINWTMQKFLE